MSPTSEWMSEKYDEMNTKFFGGQLGGCDFGIFTTGKGSMGRTLGRFKITGDGIKYSKRTRRMFKETERYFGDVTFVSRNNFVDLCKPRIELNGNYKWTEKAALSTLVHEMCHYYNYMYGYVPIQGHGEEFKEIAYEVSNKSKGIFTVERLAKAEQMQEMELDSAIAAKNQERRDNRKKKMIPVLVYRRDGEIRLINCGSYELVNYIMHKEANNGSTVKCSTDEGLKNFLFSKGCRIIMRGYGRYYSSYKNPFLKTLDNFPMETLYSNKETDMKNVENSKPQEKRIPLFRITLNGGENFELRNVTEKELRDALRARFPKWSDDAIERIASTEKYRLNEDKIRKIVTEVLEELRGSEGDIGVITPDMNLGIMDLD